MYPQSQSLFARAQQVIPGGVNSPVRAFRSVGGTPLFIARAEGAYLIDEDGNRYLDYINSWGPMIMGHAWPKVVAAVQQQAALSTSYGAPTRLEAEMAEQICAMVPNVEQVRMVNSGTEACMSALRLARGYTGRDKVIKFAGCYHGHADAFLIKAGSGAMTLGQADSPGITAATAADTLIAPYNDLAYVQQLVRRFRGEIAAIILEPLAGNMGCVLPQPGFLEGLRTLCDEEGIVLIFDEVMTGFRLAAGGAQEAFGVNADLVTLGKIIGGGLPVGAFGGKREIMSHLAPLGRVYQAGTLSGNPLAMSAGLTLLRELAVRPEIYTGLAQRTKQLAEGIRSLAAQQRVPVQVPQYGSMLSVFFTERPVQNFEDAQQTDRDRFSRFFHSMLEQGVYLPPSPFESWFVSTTIGEAERDKTLGAVALALERL